MSRLLDAMGSAVSVIFGMLVIVALGLIVVFVLMTLLVGWFFLWQQIIPSDLVSGFVAAITSIFIVLVGIFYFNT